ncbi:MAG TPA: hypothetical protein VF462_05090 [Micromonosporaceae bacterium]
MTERARPRADQTAEMPPQPSPYRRGVAHVGAGRPRPTDTTVIRESPTGWPGDTGQQARLPLGYRMAQLRRGRQWSTTGAVFALVCWGIWAASSLGNLGSPMATLVITSLVAVGLFALARLVGRLVWERQLGRVRRSARGAHLVTAVFLVAVGVAFLRQTEWVVTAWNWVVNW